MTLLLYLLQYLRYMRQIQGRLCEIHSVLSLAMFTTFLCQRIDCSLDFLIHLVLPQIDFCTLNGGADSP